MNEYWNYDLFWGLLTRDNAQLQSYWYILTNYEVWDYGLKLREKGKSEHILIATHVWDTIFRKLFLDIMDGVDERDQRYSKLNLPTLNACFWRC